VEFKSGDAILVEVLSFGPLGASVEVIAVGHDGDNIIADDEPALATGLILQREIQYFRQARDNADVFRGEVLPAYVERVRDDGRIDVALRTVGGAAKAAEVGELIMDRLESRESGGVLDVGDKSSPEEIAWEFPGVSKAAFKKAVSALYKKGVVTPGPFTVTLNNPQKS